MYELTVESGTQLSRDKELFEDVDSRAQEFERAVSLLESKGLWRYEVSNFARNPERQSKHNLAVWRGLNYVGLGPGAHGRLQSDDGRFWETLGLPDVRRWVQGEPGRVAELSRDDRMREKVVLGLRTFEGCIVEDTSILDMDQIRLLEQADMLSYNSTTRCLRPTSHAALNVMDSILSRILN